MDARKMELNEPNVTGAGEFVSVLRPVGGLFTGARVSFKSRFRVAETQGTTILAFKFADGVLVAGDRRATAANIVMYDRTDKVFEVDRNSV